jgi:hypothetical protein
MGPTTTKDKSRERAEKIKLIVQYYGVSYMLAQKKYTELKLTNPTELATILEKAAHGEHELRPTCPLCLKDLMKRSGRNGEFFGCIGYPECRYTRTVKSSVSANITAEQKEESQRKLKLTIDYIDSVGGLDEARRWLLIAAQSLGEGK